MGLESGHQLLGFQERANLWKLKRLKEVSNSVSGEIQTVVFSLLRLLAGLTTRARKTLASPKRGRLESTGSQEGGTEAQQLGARSRRGSRMGVGRYGTTVPGLPCELRQKRLAESASSTAFIDQ